ncbi:MAG: 30S ribosomal protein S12 methylthiotransferase RimO, partial [Muribaculaceae bacterium]|nr:30S ribosomal protein S12 methylthiotransferase RimO [Muribaculaceae bacterium]
IQDAKEESIELILQLGQLKKTRKIGHLAVMGCLSQRYMDDLKAEIPEVDIWYGKFDWKDFIDRLPARKDDQHEQPKEWERSLTTPPHSTYLKISEGCNRFCAFCAIPIITGRHTSRPIEEILDETRELVAKGVRDFNIIAQDLSSYGTDLYGRHALPELIDRMAEVPGVEWIRLHYAYPSDFPMELLDVMARHDNVCKYLDIALQHISDKVLTNMRRHINGQQTRELLAEMRRRVPGLKIRTTLMVGFPGEGEKEFEELLDFVREQRFERMGAFAYSEEDDTWAAKNLGDDIPQETKQARLDRLMELQQEISFQRNLDMVGQTVHVLIDRIEGDTCVGRTQWDSPEVDPEIYVK